MFLKTENPRLSSVLLHLFSVYVKSICYTSYEIDKMWVKFTICTYS